VYFVLAAVGADNVDELECSKGVLPTLRQQLQLPNTKHGRGRLGRTCLLGSSCSTFAASWDGVSPFQQASAVLTFDMQTQRATNAFMGHMWAVKAIAAAPEAWPGSEYLLATAAQSRDIKIWDVRCSGGAAAITLVSGGVDHIAPPFNAVVLAGNSGGSSGGSSSSSSSQLGAGLMCFAGGTCESVWAWDVRASSAQALYQLSTGNQEVTSLAWHAASNTLIANCEAHHDW
jgi:WD40 repeat protein